MSKISKTSKRAGRAPIRAKPVQPPRKRPPQTFTVDENILVFAFRYALGRRTGAPSHLVAILRLNWPRLEKWTQEQIQREIRTAINLGDAGSDCDVDTWKEILALPPGVSEVEAAPEVAPSQFDECPGCGMSRWKCLCSHED